ncbi:MAG: hypothetical protein QOF42_715 [Gammaproteobacteria bacterium]|jgi:hypothetical protein|nr:hypothetical protein [Gammaproteobacteria bacterium]
MSLILTEHPLTRAERTGYSETSSHADVLAFIEGLRKLGGSSLYVTDFGKTPEGRVLPLLVLSNRGYFAPQEALRANLPIVLILCGIHAGEVEGKESALMLVRDILRGRYGELLDRITLLVAPLFNADGNDRIDPCNRELDIQHLRGQIGPAGGVGTRENAAGINLNRDYMRQDSAEMRALQRRVCQPWNPHLVIDCHTTNGSIHRFAMTFDIPHVVDSARREPIEYMRSRMMPAVQSAVKAHDGLDSSWYGNFQRDEGGHGTGWITYTHHPRFGGNYRGLTNRLDLLLETYAYLPFDERVRASYGFLRETLIYVAAHADEVVKLLERCREPPPRIAVSYRLEAFEDRKLTVLTREPYDLTGEPIEVTVPHVAKFVGENLVKRPLAYAVPANVARHLAAHGLAVEEPSEPLYLTVEIAVVRNLVAEPAREILEADMSVHLEVDLLMQKRLLPDHWWLVYTAQQRGAIAVYMCEARSDDGLLACGLIGRPQLGDEFPAWRVHGVGTI